jgi:hypothetical protein
MRREVGDEGLSDGRYLRGRSGYVWRLCQVTIRQAGACEEVRGCARQAERTETRGVGGERRAGEGGWEEDDVAGRGRAGAGSFGSPRMAAWLVRRRGKTRLASPCSLAHPPAPILKWKVGVLP